MKALLKQIAQKLGYTVERIPRDAASKVEGVADLESGQLSIVKECLPFTMTSVPRMASLLCSLDYLIKYRVPGNIAECGVWKGGSMMIAAKTLLAAGDTSRSLYLFDTFEGMSEPTDDDTHGGGDTSPNTAGQHPERHRDLVRGRAGRSESKPSIHRIPDGKDSFREGKG